MDEIGEFSLLHTVEEEVKKDAVSVFSYCPAEGGICPKKRPLNKALAEKVFGDCSCVSAVPTPQAPPAVFNGNCFSPENAWLFSFHCRGSFLFSQGACGAFVILASLQLSLQEQDRCPARPDRLTVPCSLP